MYHFIINPKSSSGKGIRHWWDVKKELDRRGVSYQAYITTHAGHATELSAQICRDHSGMKNIVILGGDGTMNEVITGLSNLEHVLLGYIPSGSSNDLARSMKIPKNSVKALERVLKPSRFVSLDYGTMECCDFDAPARRFCCSSGFGYDASVCAEVQSSALKKRLNHLGAGKLIYLAIAIKQIVKIKLMKVTVLLDDYQQTTYSDVLLVSPMIHRYEGGGLLMAPDADPCDGKLSVTLIHGLSRLKIFLLLPTILFGKHILVKGVETFHCKKLEILSDSRTYIHTDGEVPYSSTHVRVSCTPGQIRMIL